MTEPEVPHPEVHHPLRPFLRNWIWEHGHIGTRYLDCADGAVKFDEGRKARFAAEKIIVVSLQKEADPAALVTAPALHEGGLARFLHAAQVGKPPEAGTAADVQRAVQDCIELAVLCAYQHEARGAHARYSAEAMFDDEIRAAVATDIRRSYLGRREKLALFDWAVLYGLPSPLMMSEAPLLDWRVQAKPPQPFVSLPLAPHALLVGTPSGKTSRAGPVHWKEVKAMGPFADHNRLLAAGARQWLVATSDEQLIAAPSQLAIPKS